MTIRITEKDERDEKFEALKKLAVELHIPVPELHLRRKIENPGCETIIKDGRSHTWVRNYYNLIFAGSAGGYTQWNTFVAAGSYGAGSLKIKFSGGSEGNPNSGAYQPATNNNITTTAISYGGIWIGTGDTAYSFEDYALAAIIANGSGTGEMAYGAMAHQTPAYTSGTKEWAQTMKRVFNNNSAAAIGVKEVGLAGYASTLNARDVLGSTDTINVGGQYTVTYTVKMTFPE
jgi:hypothetical protein